MYVSVCVSVCPFLIVEKKYIFWQNHKHIFFSSTIHISRYILPWESQIKALFSPKHSYFLLYLTCQTSLENFYGKILKNAFIKTHRRSLEQIGTNWWFKKKRENVSKISWPWLKFGFQLPKDMVLELIQKHSSCSEPIS